VLAGKIPADLAERLTSDLEAIRLFRSVAGNVESAADWKEFIESKRRKTAREE